MEQSQYRNNYSHFVKKLSKLVNTLSDNDNQDESDNQIHDTKFLWKCIIDLINTTSTIHEKSISLEKTIEELNAQIKDLKIYEETSNKLLDITNSNSLSDLESKISNLVAQNNNRVDENIDNNRLNKISKDGECDANKQDNNVNDQNKDLLNNKENIQDEGNNLNESCTEKLEDLKENTLNKDDEVKEECKESNNEGN